MSVRVHCGLSKGWKAPSVEELSLKPRRGGRMSSLRLRKACEIPCSGLGTGRGQTTLPLLGSLPTNSVSNIPMTPGRETLPHPWKMTYRNTAGQSGSQQAREISKVRHARLLIRGWRVRNSCVSDSGALFSELMHKQKVRFDFSA